MKHSELKRSSALLVHPGPSPSSWRSLLRRICLQEPTFREMLVVCRRKNPGPPEWLERYQRARVGALRLVDRIVDGGDRAARAQAALDDAAHRAAVRPPVQLRILDDIPMAYWQAVFPDKLMQFKPLDGLRLDLITVVGVCAVIAQIKVTNPLLELVSIVSVIVAVVRSVLGYRRMSIRYENFLNDMIATKTLAQEDAVVEFLARAAARQRFAAAALAYAALQRNAVAARTDVAAVAAAEAAAAAAGDAAAAAAARRAAAPLLAQPWLSRFLPAAQVAESATGSGGAAAAALLSLLAEGQQLLAAVRGSGQGDAVEEEAGWQGPGMTAAELRQSVEATLEGIGMGHVRFDVQGALRDLQEASLIQHEETGVRSWLQEAGLSVVPASSDTGGRTGLQETQAVAPDVESDASRGGGAVAVRAADSDAGSGVVLGQRFMPVDGAVVDSLLSQHWTALLEDSVESSLAAVL